MRYSFNGAKITILLTPTFEIIESVATLKVLSLGRAKPVILVYNF